MLYHYSNKSSLIRDTRLCLELVVTNNMQRKRATSLQMDGQIQNDGEHDFVPEHLVSPFTIQSRLKTKGHLHRVYNEDFIDMGVIPPVKHPSLISRRQSDPGRISPAVRHRYGGSCSSSDDEEYEKSPRSHSPRHFVGPVPEEEGYLTGGLDGRLSPGLSSSPRRRLVHQRYSTSLPMNTLMGDESPRIRPRTFRSNSLPLQFMSFEVGEAVGALALRNVSPDQIKRNKLPDGCKSGTGGLQGTTVSSAKRTHVNRWVSIEEPLLECILEENGARISKPRRLSMPQCFSSEKYSKALP